MMHRPLGRPADERITLKHGAGGRAMRMLIEDTLAAGFLDGKVDGLGLAALDDGTVNLRSLQEIQGEGVGIGPDGLVALTSEGGPLGGPPSLRLMRCRLGG